MVNGGVEHLLELIFIFGRNHGKVGNKPQEGEVKNPMMGRTVIADYACPVQGKSDRQVG